MVTDSVIDEVRAWQSRPLESVYAVVFFDALRVKIRDEGLVRNKAVYLAIGMRCSGHKEVLGITAKWKNPPIAWAHAKAQFAIQFADRFNLGD